MTHALELHGVRKIFRSDLLKGKQIALDGLTCTFASGACTGLLGANGAGKTTTIRLVLGLIRPDQGEILFEGKPISTESKLRIGYMPEVNKLPHLLTPEELLHTQLGIYRPDAYATKSARGARVDEILTEVGLAQHRKKRVGQLSKGMARRLAWGLATCHQPKLLVLDEPSSGLDPLGRRQMLSWIEREKRRGATIVLCTHELLQIKTLCDDLHILRKGKLVLSSAKGKRKESADIAWRHHYNLEVSGVDDAALTALQGSGLPPWLAMKREGYVAVLGFADYKDAAPWLTALVGKGYVVLRFGDESYMDEEDLLPYFEAEG